MFPFTSFDAWQEEIILETRKCIVSTTQSSRDWNQRDFYLFISLKNHLFTGDLIDWFIRVCIKYQSKSYISVVNSPYLLNESVKLGRELLPYEEERIFQISNEREKQIHRVLKRYPHHGIHILAWTELALATPHWIKDEIQEAFHLKKRFYTAVINQTKYIKSTSLSIESLEGYSQFVLEELPVLLYTYYSNPLGVVDFYPGENFKFFTELEQGGFQNELPKVTNLIQANKPLVYIQVT